ncbi:predicted protein [Thalassiosira pseudonana CCMP1335]|jgi:hypothetical protein|uniref:Uncharacterized protein n=1 Tax=Thalassiosira pseudonana TaxID=35128 RepID=B8LCX0_THAPS|nr:predicted protein [Thalassiosira pseudonana CCMP1335]EED86838.1 predicted protein [Thalassiosira pseudonana CCMP1335]
MKVTRCTRFFFLYSCTLFFGLYQLKQPSEESLVARSSSSLANANTKKNLDIFGPPPDCSDTCLSEAGVNGTWIQDWDFATNHGQFEYRLYPRGPFGDRTYGSFVPSDDAPFPWETSWKWKDYNEDCQVDIMTHDMMCEVLTQLSVDRIFFYGDSLTQSMYTSLMNKLGGVKVGKYKFRAEFTCETSASYASFARGNVTMPSILVTIQVHHGRDEGGQGSPNSLRGIWDIDDDTRSFITQSNERVLGVFNIGAHYHNFTHYREDMDKLLLTISGLNRTQDLYFFRTTSPGHDGCEPRSRQFDWKHGTRIVPLKSFSEYRVAIPHKYDWDQFEKYNAHAERMIYEHNLMRSNPTMHYLNIYNMTALRHDAHTAPVS